MPATVEITEIRCPHASTHKSENNILLRQRPNGTLFCPVHGDIWTNQHAPDCEVTRARADLLEMLSHVAPEERPYLMGAFVEYDLGGDQEVELCNCGFVK